VALGRRFDGPEWDVVMPGADHLAFSVVEVRHKNAKDARTGISGAERRCTVSVSDPAFIVVTKWAHRFRDNRLGELSGQINAFSDRKTGFGHVGASHEPEMAHTWNHNL
jgi:hypothetical protein